MIEFYSYEGFFIDRPEDDSAYHSIAVTDKSLPKLIKVIERGINTLSPPDPELIKLLDDMKGVK